VLLLEVVDLAGRMNDRQSERPGVCLGKALSGGFARGVEIEEYRRMAAVEDDMWFYRTLHAHIDTALVNRLTAPRAELLDVGCGTGGLIRRLGRAHPSWRWLGVDVEPLACELARARCGADIVQASATALPFAGAAFDAVVAADMLYHLDDDVAALRECLRVLRPGGTLVVNVPAHRWLWSYHDVTVHGRRRYVRRELAAKLREAGFELLRLTHWNLLPLPLVIVRRKLLPPPRSGSDVRLYPRPVEAAFRGLMAVERGWMRRVGDLPAGSSILAIATKPR
jgi:SAM-dependent methyltransferase